MVESVKDCFQRHWVRFKEVEASLEPGRSALFLLLKRNEPGLLIGAMRQYSGTVVQTSLDEEAAP